MHYTGVIIEESLGNKAVFKHVKILSTQVEKASSKHSTPWVKQWTLHTIEVPEKKADKIAQLLTESFDPTHPQWYADFKNERYHYIAYNGQLFKIDRSQPEEYKDAREYGISIGIPEYQVDFASKDKVWKR